MKVKVGLKFEITF